MSTNELARLKAAKRKAADKGSGENPIKDGPNLALDDLALEQANELLTEYGPEKLRKLFPGVFALLEQEGAKVK